MAGLHSHNHKGSGADDGPRKVLDPQRQTDGRAVSVGKAGKNSSGSDKLATLLVELPLQVVLGHQVRLLLATLNG